MRNRIGASGARCNSNAHATASRRAGERDHEAVALTLLDRPHPAVGGEQVRKRAVQARDGGRHLVRLGLPQPRRALDIGEQQRHRSGWQLAHAQLTPVHRRHVRAWISFGHASQHLGAGSRKHQ